MGKELKKRSVFENKSQKTQNLQFRLYFNKKYQSKNLHKWFESKVRIKKNFKILDVGCGTGKQSVYFKKKINNSGQLFSFDKSIKSIIQLKKKIGSRNSKIFSADMNEIEKINKNFFEFEKFDLISSVYSIYYARKPLKLIKFLLSKLDKNGKLLLLVPMRPNKITEIAEKFYKLPTKVTESLVIFKKIINYFTKQKYNIRVRYFRSKIRVNNIEDVIKFYKSTTFFKKKYEKTISKFIKKKFKKKGFIFKKDSCLIILKNEN
tara:strand:- start:19779 stop:20567 length:789 start_codon:yes stop_codon:yes gene_type:complete